MNLTDGNPWVIEFRSGSYFYSLKAERGVTIERAQRFASMRSVDDFITKHEWILFNGGMPVEICATCSKLVAYRGQVHCKPIKELIERSSIHACPVFTQRSHR